MNALVAVGDSDQFGMIPRDLVVPYGGDQRGGEGAGQGPQEVHESSGGSRFVFVDAGQRQPG